MAQRTLFDFGRPCPPPSSPRPSLDMQLVRQRRELEACRLGLPWPWKGQRGPGRRSHRDHFEELLYEAIRSDPDSTGHLENAVKPAWWSPGMGLHQPEAPPHHVAPPKTKSMSKFLALRLVYGTGPSSSSSSSSRPAAPPRV